MKTHEYITKYNELKTSYINKQNGLQKLSLDPIPEYYKYINELDDINEEFNGFSKEPHTVPEGADNTIIIPYNETLSVSGMIDNNSAITNYCTGAHKALSVAKNIDTYKANLNDLKTKTDTAIEYQNKLHQFAEVEWDLLNIKYSIISEHDTNGTVTVQPTAVANSSVAFTVQPNENYVINSVKVVATEDETEEIECNIYKNNQYIFTMPEKSVTIKTTFEEAATNNKVNIHIGDTGVADITPDKRTATVGEKVTLKVSVPQGSVISAVKVNGVALDLISSDSTGSIYEFTVTGDAVEITAETSVAIFTITAVQTEHGTISVDKESAEFNTKINVTITPDLNYELSEIKVVTTIAGKPTNIEYEETASGISFNMPAGNVTITPTFTFNGILRTINVVSTGNGTISADKENGYVGDSIVLTITPSQSFEVDTITSTPEVTITSLGTNKYNFVMPNSDITITVSFKELIDIPIEFAAIDPTVGTLSANKTSAKKGETITVTATIVDTGYNFDGFTIVDTENNNIPFTAEEDNLLVITFTMPETKVTITGTFTKKNFTLPTVENVVFKNAENEVITQADYEDIVTYEVTCPEGKTIKSLIVNDSEVTAAYKQDNYTNQFTVSNQAPTLSLEIANIINFNITKETGYGEITQSTEKPISGEQVTVTFEIEPGYELKYNTSTTVILDTTQTDNGILKITMPQEGSLTLNFLTDFKYYDLITNDLPIVITDNIIAAHMGQTVTFSVTTPTDYEINTLTVTGTNSGELEIGNTDGLYSFVMPTEPVTFNVTFKKKQYTINKVLEGTNNEHATESVGTIDIVGGATTAESGTKINFTVTPATTFQLQSVQINNGAISPVENEGIYSFDMPQGEVTIKALFYHL